MEYVSGKRGYLEGIKLLVLDYTTNSWDTVLDLNKISVLASWELAFSLKASSWIGGYQRFIAVSPMHPLQNLGKHSWKLWPAVRFVVLVYVLWFYWTNIYQ